MSEDDPFASDRTIIKPTPGGRGRRQDADTTSPSRPAAFDAGPVQTTGANPLLKAATPLLAIGGQLRRSAQYDNSADLFRQLTQGIRKFEADLKATSESSEDVSLARYVLCGFLDEAILNTPWGAEIGWSSHTLLAEFHKESYAGEKVFELMERMLGNPSRYLYLLELVYVCVSLGFRGKYRLGAGGEDRLEDVRHNLYRVIARERGPAERELSPAWRGAQDVRPKLTRFLPAWVVFALCAGIMVLVYVTLYFTLEADSDPVVGEIALLGRGLEPVVDRAPQFIPVQPQPSETLMGLLRGNPGASVVEAGSHDNAAVLRELFPSGSADVGASYFGALREVAQAIGQLEGRVVVTGHSDNVPIRSIRFPSNWQLSAARAQSVADILLANGVAANRITSEPRADTEPVCAECDQDSPAERARNRRVEIEVLARAQRQ